MTRTSIALGVLLLLASGIASSQFSGAIEGYVKDATGTVIPGAEILVTDENLGLEREASANETGFFRIGELPAGSYAASVASTGFVTWSTPGLLVRSNETRTLYQGVSTPSAALATHRTEPDSGVRGPEPSSLAPTQCLRSVSSTALPQGVRHYFDISGFSARWAQ